MEIKYLEDRICDIRFCRQCTLAAFEQWKGWPIRDAVPSLPIIGGNNKCPICGGTNEVVSTNIAWLNVHGPYSTGLPDYWVLIEGDENPGFHKKFPSKWGLPYYESIECPKCKGKLLSSVFCPSIGWEIRRWCVDCGFGDTKRQR